MALAYAPAPALSARPCRATRAPRSGLVLTRRGRLAIVLLAAIALLALAPWRAIASTPAGTVPTGWAAVTVAPGDTLWEYAESAAPGADPRPLIAEIKAVNDLSSSTLQPGQVLVVPAAKP